MAIYHLFVKEAIAKYVNDEGQLIIVIMPMNDLN